MPSDDSVWREDRWAILLMLVMLAIGILLLLTNFDPSYVSRLWPK